MRGWGNAEPRSCLTSPVAQTPASAGLTCNRASAPSPTHRPDTLTLTRGPSPASHQPAEQPWAQPGPGGGRRVGAAGGWRPDHRCANIREVAGLRWEMRLTCQPEERDPGPGDPVHLPQLPIQMEERAKWEAARARGPRAPRCPGGGGRERLSASLGAAPGGPWPGPRARPLRTQHRLGIQHRLRTQHRLGIQRPLRTQHARRRARVPSADPPHGGARPPPPRPAAPPAARPAASEVSGSRAGPAASAESPGARGRTGSGGGRC